MKLIIINGSCGVGKSVLAKKIHDSIPLSYLLDVDTHSRNISHYREYREERWKLSLAVAQAVIGACLSVGQDVIVDKMTYDPLVLDSYHQIAKKYKASVYEILLWAPKNLVMKRADERGWRKGGLLTPEKCERFWYKIDELKEKRSLATVIDISNLNEDEVFKKAQEVLI